MTCLIELNTLKLQDEPSLKKVGVIFFTTGAIHVFYALIIGKLRSVQIFIL